MRTGTRAWTAVAPVRIADLGGWTDTWFAGGGLVCSLAVHPGVEVRLQAEEPPSSGRARRPGRVTIDAVDLGDRYRLDDGRGRQPLLEACFDEVGVPPGVDVTVTIRSAVPPGAATGTSAAVAVALVAALAARAGESPAPAEVARRAWRAEAVRVGRQSGVQDQYAAAFGGANRIVIEQFPDAVRVEPIALDAATRASLEERLLLVVLGRPHVSSAVHETVIAELEAAGPVEAGRRLAPLRAAAAAGADALAARDLEAYGRALDDNTAAQVALHPSLVSAEARAILGAARAAGASGAKVNGAGGDGGSLTVLGGSTAGGDAAVAAAVATVAPSASVRRVRMDEDGVQVRVSPPRDGG